MERIRFLSASLYLYVLRLSDGNEEVKVKYIDYERMKEAKDELDAMKEKLELEEAKVELKWRRAKRKALSTET